LFGVTGSCISRSATLFFGAVLYYRKNLPRRKFLF
jgi:hypothetical protein